MSIPFAVCHWNRNWSQIEFSAFPLLLWSYHFGFNWEVHSKELGQWSHFYGARRLYLLIKWYKIVQIDSLLAVLFKLLCKLFYNSVLLLLFKLFSLELFQFFMFHAKKHIFSLHFRQKTRFADFQIAACPLLFPRLSFQITTKIIILSLLLLGKTWQIDIRNAN